MNEKELFGYASRIKMLLLDVDGVLTDGGIILDSNGKETKVFYVRDGHGIKLLQKRGVRVGIITGRESEVVRKRAEELGIQDVYQRCEDKLIAFQRIKEKTGFSDDEFCYIGDDIVDIPLLKRVGFSVTVSDAVEEVKKIVHFVTNKEGGRGAVREVAEFILKAKGLWEEIVDEYMAA